MDTPSIAETLIPWAVLGLLLVLVVGGSFLATFLAGWLKARSGTSKLALLAQLVVEHIEGGMLELKATATAEALRIAADGKVTPAELAEFRAILVAKVLSTLPKHAKAIGAGLFGDMLPAFVGVRVDELVAVSALKALPPPGPLASPQTPRGST